MACGPGPEEGAIGLIYIATDGTTKRYTEKQGLTDDDVMSIYRDDAQNLWVGTARGGLNRLRDEKFDQVGINDGLAKERIDSIFEDREGSLWVGTGASGLSRFRDGQFSSITVRDGLSAGLVWSVYADPAGGLLVGGEHGFAVVQGGRVVRRYSEKDGLLNDVIAGFYRDADGSLWIGTEGGVSRLRNGVFYNIRVKDGLSNPDIRVVSGDGRNGMYFGSHGGGLIHRQPDGTMRIIGESGWADA